jgi:hypothetical protein
VELQQVLYPEGLEQQHHIGQVGPLNLRHCGGQELIFVGALCVQPVREKTLFVLCLPVAGLLGFSHAWLPTGIMQ